jgi:hypothetical protein
LGKIIAKSETLKVRLSCKACHAEERATFRSAPPTPLFRFAPPLRFRSSAKSIAPSQIAIAEKFGEKTGENTD